MSTKIDMNENQTRQVLSEMDRRRRLCFGAACCERLYDFYATYSDDTKLREYLDLLWSAALEGKEIVNHRLKAEECRNLLSGHEDETLEESYATDAISAVYFCLSSMGSEDPIEELIWVSRLPLSVVDQLAMIDLTERHQGAVPREDELQEHPWVQTELRLQQADLELLAQDADSCEWLIREKAVANRIPVPPPFVTDSCHLD